MLIYSINVVAIVIVSSLILIYLLKRNNILDIRIVLAAAVSAIVVSILFPLNFSSFYSMNSASSGLQILLSLLAAFVVHAILILIFTMLITSIVTEAFCKRIISMLSFKNLRYKGIDIEKLVRRGETQAEAQTEAEIEANAETEAQTEIAARTEVEAQAETEVQEEVEAQAETETQAEVDEQVKIEEQVETETASEMEEELDSGTKAVPPLEDIYKTIVEGTENPTPREADSYVASEVHQEGSLPEKPVDTKQIVGKMEVDALEYSDQQEKTVEIQTEKVEAVDLNLDECIEEAFALKDAGDFEGALLYYMYALDKNPEDDIVFWIVIDICVLYKALGKQDLAREILESYAQSFGDVIDDSLRLEIERNLHDA